MFNYDYCISKYYLHNTSIPYAKLKKNKGDFSTKNGNLAKYYSVLIYNDFYHEDDLTSNLFLKQDKPNAVVAQNKSPPI